MFEVHSNCCVFFHAVLLCSCWCLCDPIGSKVAIAGLIFVDVAAQATFAPQADLIDPEFHLID